MTHQLFTREDLHNKSFKLQAGDFILGHKENFSDRLIHLVTHSPWNHAALVIDPRGTLIEGTYHGLQKTKVSCEEEDEVYIVRVPMTDNERKNVVAYAEKMLGRQVNFDFLGLLSVLLYRSLKIPLIIKFRETQICSEFVANALLHGGYIWENDTTLITPADLYNKFVKGHHQRT